MNECGRYGVGRRVEKHGRKDIGGAGGAGGGLVDLGGKRAGC